MSSEMPLKNLKQTSDSVNETSSNTTEEDKKKAATLVQSLWRMRSARHSYHEHLRGVHITTFIITLLIRLFVISYLTVILFSVRNAISNKNAETANNPANAEDLEQIVLRELMTTNSAGIRIITACRYVLTG